MAYAYPVFPVSPAGTPIHLTPAVNGVPLPGSPYGYPSPPIYSPTGYAPAGYSPVVMAGALPGQYGYMTPGHSIPHGLSQLHGLLHYTKHFRVMFDLRQSPSAITLPNGSPIPHHERDAPATLPPTAIIRIVCAQLPWHIDIDLNAKHGDEHAAWRPHGSAITLHDFFERLHHALRSRVTTSEWLIADQKKRDKVGASYKERCEIAGHKEFQEGVKWIDWLGKNFYFMGLTKDDRVVKEILQGRAQEVPETWVLVTGSR